MFTGIVESGEVVEVSEGRISVRAPLLDDAPPGASVAVDGVCLTVTSREGATCDFDVSVETSSRTTLGGKRPGDRVNLERPLRASDELGGHVVQGHVDGVGRVLEVAEEGNGRRVRIACGPGVMRYVVEKGSITVDGVSLTATRVDTDAFEVALIPHTLEITSLGEYAEEREVNLEVDVLAKYVEKLTVPWGPGRPDEPAEASGYL